MTSFFNARKLLPVRVVLLLLPLLLRLAQQQVPMSRQPHCLTSLLLRRSQWHAQAPRKGQDAASTKNRWTPLGRDPQIPSMPAND